VFRFFLLFFLFVTLNAKASENILAYLNAIRQNSGLIAFKPNAKLDKAATAHAKYLLRHQKIGHYERKGKQGFTGKSPSDRVLYADYASKAVMENVSVNAKNPRHAVDILFSAIYHRFVFLNFDKNEAGAGRAFGNKHKKISSTFVYELGSTTVSELCKGQYPKMNGFFYIENLCKGNIPEVPQILFKEKKNEIRRANGKIILYPYPGAVDIPPAFYTEHPHPLPGSKVSGYPVSVQFNPAFYKRVKFKEFRLYDEKGKEVKHRKILTHANDRNHRFTKFEFAFMPLERLSYGTTYKVEFKAIADEKKIRKNWSFTTRRPEGMLYTVTKKNTTIKIKKGEKIILYFNPENSKDVIKRLRHTNALHTEYLDQNTLLVNIPDKKSTSKGYLLKADGKKVFLKF